MIIDKNLKKIKLILIHVLIGTSIFYFLIHPFTVVLYWFEYSHTAYSFTLFTEILKDRLLESFSFKMIRMSTLFTLFGGFLGLISGIFWISFKEKKHLIKKQEQLLKRDIQNIIEMGESDWVEFKSSMRYDYRQKKVNRELELVITKTIVGFMNAQGGKLIIGVDDSGNIIGLENDFNTFKQKNKDSYERKIFKNISNYIDQQSCFKNQVSFYQFEGKDVCLIDVKSSINPVYFSDGENTTFYVRTGNATYPLSVKDAIKYIKNRKPY